MNEHMTTEEFEALPFRDDIKGDYINGCLYRARAYPMSVFRWTGKPGSGAAGWSCFGVLLRPKPNFRFEPYEPTDQEALDRIG